MPLTPGATFERYEIVRLVGRGGMGEVYEAIDGRLHRPVALKVLRTDTELAADVSEAGGVARLLREARAAAAFNHANSVGIYELGEAEGIPYIAMELVKGESLRAYCGNPNVSLDTKVGWLVDAARALWAAHKAGLVHRDIKPGNIMVSEEGVVKVLDFGLAKPTRRGDPTGFQTMMGAVLGTPKYMAPEQLEGHPPDASADQFGFGITAYELISGKYPGGPLAGTFDSLDAITPGVTSELAAAVARMMARAPSDRFATMEEAAHALRSAMGRSGGRTAPAPAPAPAHQSEAPTRAVPREGGMIVENDMPLTAGTLPMASPIRISAAAVADAPPSPRTLPLGASHGVQLPPPSGGSPALARQMPPPPDSVPNVSGVFPTGSTPSQPMVVPVRANNAPKAGGSLGWVLVAVFVASLFVAAGATAALMLR